MIKEFKEFIMRGNVMDMAVGIIIGAAFGTIVSSLVKDVIMPPIGLLLGKVDFANLFAVLKQGTTPGPDPSVAAAPVSTRRSTSWQRLRVTRVPSTRSRRRRGRQRKRYADLRNRLPPTRLSPRSTSRSPAARRSRTTAAST